jgi:hypothetical protein
VLYNAIVSVGVGVLPIPYTEKVLKEKSPHIKNIPLKSIRKLRVFEIWILFVIAWYGI